MPQYLADSPMSAYGSIPLMYVHSSDSTIDIFNVVALVEGDMNALYQVFEVSLDPMLQEYQRLNYVRHIRQVSAFKLTMQT